MKQWQQAKTADVMHSKLSCIFNEPPKVSELIYSS